MKKILIIISVLVILIIGGVFPAEQVEHNSVKNESIGNVKQAKNVIKVDVPFILLFKAPLNYFSYVLTYERVLTKNASLSVTPQLLSPHGLTDGPSGLGIILALRLYPSKTKYTPSGWFVEFPVSVLPIFESHYGFSGGFSSAGVGGGYQWIFRNGFVLDIFADIGAGYVITIEKTLGLPIARFGINLGYAF